MQARRGRSARNRAGLVGLAVPALLLASASGAAADPGDIALGYSTANYPAADAPIDGSYTVQGRVGIPRDDMRLIWTIAAADVTYPFPELTATGSLAGTAQATYTFAFGCDATVTGNTCASPSTQAKLGLLNAGASTLNGRSVSTFSADVTPLMQAFGSSVPPGISAVVTVHVLSQEPGTGALTFRIVRGSASGATTGEVLSATATTPLVITQPVIAPPADSQAFCVAGADKQTGRGTLDLVPQVTDDGIKPDDVTPVGVDLDAGLVAVIDDAPTRYTDTTALTTAVLALPVGVHTVTYSYTAPDGVPAADATASVEVLSASGSICETATLTPTATPPPSATATASVSPTATATPTPTASAAAVVTRTGATELASTGADPHVGLLIGVGAVALGGLLVAARTYLTRRRTARGE